ncbi:MAG TPA: HDOD domain-containing protein [Polyangia bacterium]|jgi:HD-like signal output (HDOD) protein|nr:HDOD domain-containing protein [Polyangia bacterium]
MIDPALKAELEKCPTLPSLPAVAVQVMRLCQAEDLDLSAIAKVISNDPALAAKILRLVNSSAYGLPQQVKTVSHAVALLGLNTVRTLALSFSLARDLRSRPQVGVDLRSYWKRSLLSAVAARELAMALSVAHLKEEAFLGGLLQDIGRLALLALAPVTYARITAEAGDDHIVLAAAEHKALGCDHSEVGQWLTEHWNLPPPLCLATGFSHAPMTLPPETNDAVALLIRIVALSGWLADIWLKDDAFGTTIAAREFASRLLDLRPPQLEPVLAQMAAGMGDVSSLFEIDLGTVEDIRAVLGHAKQSLSVGVTP